jgi:hydrogenase maturation protease
MTNAQVQFILPGHPAWASVFSVRLNDSAKSPAYNPAMTQSPVRCLVLACGNTLRSDDGIGPWLAAWAEERAYPGVKVLARHQWTPDLSEDVAQAESVIFLDCALDAAPGEIRIRAVKPATAGLSLATHHVGAAELLALAQELYDTQPREAVLFTVGAGSTDLGENFSKAVLACLPEASTRLDEAIRKLLIQP